MSTPDVGYPLEELDVCGPVPDDVLTGIERFLVKRSSSDTHVTAYLEVAANGEVLTSTQPDLNEPLLEIAEGIQRYQLARDGLIGVRRLHAAIVPFSVEPTWHAEVISDAFITTTQAPTEGVRGVVPAHSFQEAQAYVLKKH